MYQLLRTAQKILLVLVGLEHELMQLCILRLVEVDLRSADAAILV